MHLVGTVIRGKYRIESVLGEGGMGIVVAAHHLPLDQKVAIKFLLPSTLEHKSFVERFAREARAAARIQSDHVARVLDVDTLDDGTPFMVMEMLEGTDLSRVRELGVPLHPQLAISYVLEACEAVAEAHRVGIIHRDLKPANLFLSRRADGRTRVKVLDFGISKISGNGKEASVTATSAIMGSAEYMSPEQMVSTKIADPRSDIWALGVCLYELMTACVPFEGETVTQVCALVLQTHPRSLLERRPSLPPEVNAVVMRCLDKDPNRRFQNVESLQEALRGLLSLGAEGPVSALMGSARMSNPSFAGATISSSSHPLLSGVPGPLRATDVPTRAAASFADSPSYMPHGAQALGTQGSFATSPAGTSKKVSNSIIFLAGGVGTALILGAVVLLLVVFKPKDKVLDAHGATAPASQVAPVSASASQTSAPVASASDTTAPVPSAASVPSTSASAALSSAPTATSEHPTRTTSQPAHVSKNPKAPVDCNPPFTLDANGFKHAKPQCL